MAQSSTNLNKVVPPERVVVLNGSINFRDLGGYANSHGQKIAWRKIYRAASLGGLTASDRHLLGDLDIVHDIDLRSPSEQQSYPDQTWTGAELISNPLYPPTNFGRIMSNHRVRKLFNWRHEIPNLENPIARIYQNVVLSSHSQQAFAKTFQILLDQHDNEATVFHCAAGKDRTGMTAALILMALEVPDDVIIQDYLLTNDLYNYSDKREPPTNDKIQQAVAQMNTHEGEALYIEGVLKTINEGYGGISEYWQHALQLSKSDLQKFRQKFLIDKQK
ncbi:tyrosine-protein phosphatase [Lapidilactobacillus mulanensis]|uniref:Tyrosine-protein phosphatase n=1 Tax=Lapidilactobacillus mulanensis TaxID=2485999 RepID=A0ABW4DLQ7_9LACO|nr:tyrosine-protein phosphatase [Lapidilactobacillus mulanensis]